MSRRPSVADLLWLGVLIGFLLWARVGVLAVTHGMSIDGGYYTEVARHVRDGEGLVSDISLYHAGFPRFPYPTSVYPLWPWLLGMTARVVPLTLAAHWLPALLSIVAIVGAWGFGRALSPAPLFPRALPGFHAGHVLAAMLGLHREFFTYTGLPYTEGLAFALLSLFLWRAWRLAPRADLRSAAELGLWMIALVLARAQFVIVPIAAAGAFALTIAAGPLQGRLRQTLRGAVALGIVGLGLGLWWLHLRGSLAHPGLGSLLRFDQNQATATLHPIRVMVRSPDLHHFLADRWGGVKQAWHLAREESYGEAFYTFHFALPLALLAGLLRFEWLRLGALPGWLRQPQAFGWILLLLIGLGGLLSVHLAHKVYFGEWYFTRRQATIVVFAFFPALLYLLRRGPVALGVLVLASGVMGGVRQIGVTALDAREGISTERGPDDALVAWLDQRVQAEGPIVVALSAHEPQRIGWRTHDVGYHWFHSRTRYHDLRLMFDKLGARYLIYLEPKTERWRFRRNPGLLTRDFDKLPDHPDGYTILRRKPRH